MVMMFWRKRSIAKMIREGDAFFFDGNVKAANEKYREALKRFGSRRNREKAGVHLRLALLQLSQNSGLKIIEPYFKEAIDSSPEVRYSDVESLARKFHVELSEEVYPLFRRAEIQCLKDLLESLFQNPQLRKDITVAVTIMKGGDELSVSGIRMKSYDVRTRIEIHEDAKNEGLTIICDVTFIPPASVPISRYFAVERVLTRDEVRSLIAEAIDVKSKIAREIEDSVISIIRAILNFTKNRRIIHEIDGLRITVMKGIGALWIEAVEPGFIISTAKIRQMLIIISYVTNTDFSSISKNPEISEQKMRSILSVNREDIRVLM